MTAEHLRNVVVEKRKPVCKGEPNAHAIANMLGAMQQLIYEAETPERQTLVLEAFDYNDIDRLRADATELILSLRDELGAKNWEVYFSRRREFPPYLDMPKPSHG